VIEFGTEETLDSADRAVIKGLDVVALRKDFEVLVSAVRATHVAGEIEGKAAGLRLPASALFALVDGGINQPLPQSPMEPYLGASATFTQGYLKLCSHGKPQT
jgi:hypothetical protein